MKLSEKELNYYFNQDVVPYLESQLANALPAREGERPVLVYTGAQPGAGKSRLNERVEREYPGIVTVVGDDLRQFHPDYERLMRKNPLAMPEATAQASGQWIAMSAQYLRERGADVLIETTLRSGQAMAGTIDEFRGAGYEIHLRALAVPQQVSRLSTVERYVGQVEARGAGRWTPGKAHDDAYRLAPATIETLISSGRVDRLVVENRGGEVLFERDYQGMKSTERQAAGVEAAQMFELSRRPTMMSASQAQQWCEQAWRDLGRVANIETKDSDLLSTVQHIITTDTPVMAAQAWPEDPAVRSRAVEHIAEHSSWVEPLLRVDRARTMMSAAMPAHRSQGSSKTSQVSLPPRPPINAPEQRRGMSL